MKNGYLLNLCISGIKNIADRIEIPFYKKTIRNEVIPHINEIKLTAAEFTYSGVQPAFVKITDANGKAISTEHYTFVIKDGDGNTVKEAVNVGTYSVTVKFKDGFVKKISVVFLVQKSL